MYAHKGTQPHQDCQWLPSSWQQNSKLSGWLRGHTWPRNAYLSILPHQIPMSICKPAILNNLQLLQILLFLLLPNILVCSSACYLPIGSPTHFLSLFCSALLCIIRSWLLQNIFLNSPAWAVRGRDGKLACWRKVKLRVFSLISLLLIASLTVLHVLDGPSSW